MLPYRTLARCLWTARSTAIAGTAPPHDGYIFLHTSATPTEFPVKLTTTVQSSLLLKLAELKLEHNVLVNWACYKPHSGDQFVSDDSCKAYAATVFSNSGNRLDIPEVTISNLDDVVASLKDHFTTKQSYIDHDEVHIFVCTHQSRDCRCGEQGVPVIEKLRQEISARKELRNFKVAEVGHVGGHRYAANVLIYPYGEWLGHVTPDDVPNMLDEILKWSSRWSSEAPPLLRHLWRGRMGLSKQGQNALFHLHSQ